MDATAAALLRAEGVALRAVRATVAQQTAGGVRTAAGARDLASRTGRITAETLRTARTMAKRVGSQTLATELQVVTGRDALLRSPRLTQDEERQLREDETAMGEAVLAASTALIAAKGRAGGDTLAAKLDGRVKRFVATEVAQGFNTEREGALLDYQRDPANRFLPVLLRRWNATLDRRTCSACRSLDGQSAPVGMNFDGGQVPGTVHPYCRCFSTLMPIPLYVTR